MIKKIMLSVLFIIVFSFGFLFLKFGSALTQEENTVSILHAILKLEISNNGYEEIINDNSGKMFVSHFKEKYPYGIMKEYMKNDGWVLKEQLGSAFVYVKDQDMVIIETRQFSKEYYLWFYSKKQPN